MEIKEIQCKSILTASKVEGIDYTICPYVGCMHRCLYCYVRFMEFAKDKLWGNFLYIKINGDEVVKKQIKKIKENSIISISTATDPYQPIEKKYALTRNILKEIMPYKVSVSILTKSALVTRDIDVLKDMWNVEVGFTITTLNEQVRKIFEPYASSIDERLLALETLEKNGIKTYVFIAPILPHFTERSLPKLIERIKNCGARRVAIDKLNYIGLLKFYLRKYYPELTFKNIMYENYFEKVKESIVKCCKEYNINYDVCF
jgi:DNA repair photolyase